MKAADIAHGAAICGGISVVAVAVVGIGCLVCGLLTDYREHRAAQPAPAADLFTPDTEAAIAQALAVITVEPINDDQLDRAVAAFENARRGVFTEAVAAAVDELEVRRERKARAR